MRKYIFLQVVGTLITGENASWSTPFNKDALLHLNIIIKETGAKIIITDPHPQLEFIEILQIFTDNGFHYRSNILGQVAILEHIQIKSPYDSLKLSKFPLVIGNSIKYWVDNFIEKPYNLDKRLGKQFEVWDGSKFKGMKILIENIDYKYIILANRGELLLSQRGNFIEINSTYGIHTENMKKILLYF